MTINKNAPSVQTNNFLIADSETGLRRFGPSMMEGGGGGGGASLGQGAAEPLFGAPEYAPKIEPAYRGRVPVIRQVNQPLNTVQIRRSTGFKGVNSRLRNPKLKQFKKSQGYGPPLPTQAQLQMLKKYNTQKKHMGLQDGVQSHPKKLIFPREAKQLLSHFQEIKNLKANVRKLFHSV